MPQEDVSRELVQNTDVLESGVFGIVRSHLHHSLVRKALRMALASSLLFFLVGGAVLPNQRDFLRVPKGCNPAIEWCQQANDVQSGPATRVPGKQLC